jgi:hypothetical protein
MAVAGKVTPHSSRWAAWYNWRMATFARRDAPLELRWEREQIDVTSAGPRPDKTWRFTDAAGHEHYWSDGWPTLAWFVTERWWCEDCEDEHTEGEWCCPLCEEVIAPGMTGPSPFREYMPGRVSFYLGDEEISPQRFAELGGVLPDN